MVITVKYFGAVAEAVGLSGELLDLEKTGCSIKDLRAFCEKKYPFMGQLTFQVSVNRSIMPDGRLEDGDEVAFLPPFAGG